MRVTIADVARAAGVSKSTVSRVLNSKGEVDVRTAERVRHVIDRLGYVPSSRAVGLARGRSRTLAVLTPSLSWPWTVEVLQGAVDVVEAAGYGLLLFTRGRGRESMARFVGQVSANAFDGLLVIEPEGEVEAAAALHRAGLPVVLVGDRAHHPVFPSVTTTNALGGAAAARHLLALGRRAPLVVTGPRRFGSVRERLDGFVSALEAHGVEHDPRRVVEGDFTERSGVEAVEKLLADDLELDAVFAHNDLGAAGALRALRAAGRRVPEDVAVVGFDDVPLARCTDPPLTTVRQPLRAMGTAAANLLLSRLGEAPPPAEPAVLPTELVIRDSAPRPAP
ncbi:LacI family DNA-binding transcriptional regulator [Streptomyces sp. TRM43335]|uniref:LacI family DNA-binding transcriptional regulator n=1 Tax=Streptomyces taklimakanensis TaxID=2569853 RepID=A0A6G2BI15_9ACTN|nr:LacI family DNA-binding transcriptional regulator [Streptomyces taklimakanensis]MTE21703.1 LacI family DNA-binding transcriptional regulator [Streptomyces taklimakanensis]